MPGRSASDRSGTFDLVSCRDLLHKLERELKLIRLCTGREELADFGFNFAVTAWHLTDWVWADMKDAYSLKATLAKEAGVRPPEFALKDFQDMMRRKSEDLNYCRLIATASKHVSVEHLPGDPDAFTATGSAVRSSVLLGGAPLVTSPLAVGGGGKYVLKIIVDGKRIRAVEVFERVLEYWTQFIYGHQIGDRGYGRLHPTATMPDQ